jgi:hypothetical protein
VAPGAAAAGPALSAPVPGPGPRVAPPTALVTDTMTSGRITLPLRAWCYIRSNR